MLLKNKNAVIYGGGGAIGGAVARVFAREGARVFIAGRTQAKLDAVAADITAAGGAVEKAQVDAFDQRAVEKHADAIAAKAGGIDIALNAVSIMHDQGTMLVDLSLDEFMKPIDGFLRTLFITSKAVVSHMGGKRTGVILTLSTPGSKMAAPGVLGYSVTCAARRLSLGFWLRNWRPETSGLFASVHTLLQMRQQRVRTRRIFSKRTSRIRRCRRPTGG